VINRFGLVTGLLVELGFAVSIVLHELGHSLVAIRKGCRVRSITLTFIGGAAQMERIPTRPLDELVMAAAGPAVSVALGMALILTGARVPLGDVYPPMGLNILQFLGTVNIGLAVFNLIPSFPMDGGRILRSLLARRMGRLRATFIAARLGRIIAVFFGLSGYFGIQGVIPARDWGLIAIAFFVFIAAGNEYRMVRMQEAARSGFNPFGVPFPGSGRASELDSDDVVVSPPPYENGKEQRTEVRRDG
jgi:Zn-dependent protease